MLLKGLPAAGGPGLGTPDRLDLFGLGVVGLPLRGRYEAPLRCFLLGVLVASARRRQGLGERQCALGRLLCQDLDEDLPRGEPPLRRPCLCHGLGLHAGLQRPDLDLLEWSSVRLGRSGCCLPAGSLPLRRPEAAGIGVEVPGRAEVAEPPGQMVAAMRGNSTSSWVRLGVPSMTTFRAVTYSSTCRTALRSGG